MYLKLLSSPLSSLGDTDSSKAVRLITQHPAAEIDVIGPILA